MSSLRAEGPEKSEASQARSGTTSSQAPRRSAGNAYDDASHYSLSLNTRVAQLLLLSALRCFVHVKVNCSICCLFGPLSIFPFVRTCESVNAFRPASSNRLGACLLRRHWPGAG